MTKSGPVERNIHLLADELLAPSPGEGMGLIQGVYTETITGMHKDSIQVQGRFILERITEAAELNPTTDN